MRTGELYPFIRDETTLTAGIAHKENEISSSRLHNLLCCLPKNQWRLVMNYVLEDRYRKVS